MKLSDIFFAILYGGAFILIIYFIIGLVYRPGPSTVIVYDETPVYQEPVWPWYGSYNWYPNWFPWSGYGGGYIGSYGGGRRWGPHHGGNKPWGGGGRGAHSGGFGGGARGGGGRGGH